MLDPKIISRCLFKFTNLGASVKVLMPSTDKLGQHPALNHLLCRREFLLSDGIIFGESVGDGFFPTQQSQSFVATKFRTHDVKSCGSIFVKLTPPNQNKVHAFCRQVHGTTAQQYSVDI